MEEDTDVDVLFLICHIRNRSKCQYAEDIIEGQPEMIEGEQNCDQDGGEGILGFVVGGQIAPENSSSVTGPRNTLKMQ